MVNLNKDYPASHKDIAHSTLDLLSQDLSEKAKIGESNLNYFEQTPSECIILIAAYLKFEEIAEFSLTCKNFKDIANSSEFYVELLDKSKLINLCNNSRGYTSKANIKKITDLFYLVGNKIQSLHLIVNNSMKELVNVMPSCVNLTHLKINGISANNKANLLNLMIKLQTLKSLDLSEGYFLENDLNDSDTIQFSQLTNLTSLDLKGSVLTLKGLSFLKDLKKLSWLNLNYCRLDKIDSLLQTLKLKTLKLSHPSPSDKVVTDDTIESLSKMTTLTELEISNCNLLGDFSTVHLKKLTFLTKLDLGLPYPSSNKITIEGIKNLSELPNLVSLNLSGRSLTDQGLTSISKLRSLTVLNIAQSNLISDDGIKNLLGLQSLKVFNFSYCHQIGDKGIFYVSKLINLTTVHADVLPEITGEALMSLLKLEKLTSLSLRMFKNMQKDDLKKLSEFTNLTELDLWGNGPTVTNESLKTLTSLKKLQRLNVGHNEVSIQGLSTLSELKYLTDIKY